MSWETQWESRTWRMFSKRVARPTIAVWPWGSIEQHGPRMPLETDTLLAQYFASYIEQYRHDNCLVIPTTSLGMSYHHQAFPGTVSISDTVATGMAADVLRSIYRSGLRKAFVILGHGGNRRPFEAALTLVGNELKGLRICQPLLGLFYTKEGELGELLCSFEEEVSHAGAAECSIIWAVLEAMGRTTELETYMQIPIDSAEVTLGEHGVGTEGGSPDEFRRMFPSGSKGDQSKADLEKGRRMLILMELEMLKAFDEFTAK